MEFHDNKGMHNLLFILNNLYLSCLYTRHNFYALLVFQGECSGNDEGLFTAVLQGQETLDCVLIFKPSEVTIVNVVLFISDKT